MKAIASNIRRGVVGFSLLGGVMIGGAALSAGAAHADGGPWTWCPGQSMDWPTGPDVTSSGIRDNYSWDTTVCHTWSKVSYGYGNVPRIFNGVPTLRGSSIWDGDNPPPPNPSGFDCGLMWCPVPPHEDPNFHG